MSRIQTAAAAALLGISPRTVQGLAAQGLLPGAAKIGKVWTFDRSKLIRFIAAQEAETQTRAARLRKTYINEPESGGYERPSRASSSEKALERAMLKLRAASGISESPNSKRSRAKARNG